MRGAASRASVQVKYILLMLVTIFRSKVHFGVWGCTLIDVLPIFVRYNSKVGGTLLYEI